MSWQGVVCNGAIVLDEGVRLPEGAQVEVQVIRQPMKKVQNPAEILAEIAAIPLEEGFQFSGRDHDDVLYGDRGPA